MNRKTLKKIIFFILIAAIFVGAFYYFFSFFTKGKQAITIKTNSTYYSGSDISATVGVKRVKNNKDLDAKIIAELFNEENKKVKNVYASGKVENGEDTDLLLKLPNDLETGKYELHVKSKSGFYRDTAKVNINIIKDTKSNVVISLDKGIYKPGDEVNFRALLLSKREDTPVVNDVSIYIYDGNDNKVYSNKTKTSEYGIVSGSFKLADEVNSGTYKLSIVTESQEITKDFIVNPYITPKFEASIITDKETYLVGENAEITVNSKYFFGEPVTGAEVKGTIDEKEFVGLTDAEGNFKTTYRFDDPKNINIKFTVTDTSNYMVETSKNIAVGTDIFEVEVLPEYNFIADGVDNDIYIITKNIDGTPIKTYSTITIGKVTKQVISDEKGIGKFTLTKNELFNLDNRNLSMDISVEDMNGNKIKKQEQLNINSNYGVILKTDKVKYNEEDDIEISIDSRNDLNNKTIYVFKSGELIKTVSTDDDSTIVNLGDVTGLVDIIIPNNTQRRNSYNIYSYLGSSNYLEYSKRTIFIKPSEKLNIDIKTSQDEYKPGDELQVSFETTNEKNEKIDAALLVSILDEAVLSLAENDLSIDNIKLALEDIVLSDGMTASDLYAIALDDSKETTLQSILLSQPLNNTKLMTETYVKDVDDYLTYGIILLVIAAFFIAIKLFIKSEKARKTTANLLVPISNVLAIFVVLTIYLSDFLYHLIDLPEIIIIMVEFVFAIVIYVLYLYKEKDLIFSMIKDIVICPIIFLAISKFLTLIILLIEFCITKNIDYFEEFFPLATTITVLVLLTLFAVLKVKKRNNELTAKSEIIYNAICSLIRGCILWYALVLLGEIFYKTALIIVILVYALYRKIILRENKTKIEDGKIVLNVNLSEITGMIVGAIIILIALSLISGIYSITHSFSANINDYSPDVYKSYDGNGGLSFDTQSSGNNFNVRSSTNSITLDSSKSLDLDFSFTDMVKEDTTETTNIEENNKDIKVQENVRNVFLESLAFIPELVTNEGKTELKLEISDNITTWNIQTVGNTKTGNIGYQNATFKVFKEFFVDFSLPTNSVVTDKVSIPVTLYNYTNDTLVINVNIKENDWSKIGEYERNISVPANSTQMLYVPIEIIKDGNNTLRVETTSGKISDIVEKTMTVKPNGLEINKVISSGMIEKNYSQDLIFNEEAIEGTKNIKVKLYASPIAQAIENIDAMLKMPTGCFEQTSSSLYPDILVLRYLRENNLNNKELEEKALEYISAGYQKLLTYEVNGTPGGYSLYGNSPAEPVITAFGLMEFNELSKVYEIDEKAIPEMIEYLFDVQKTNGTFDYSSTYIGGSASTDKIAMNAYITWALSEVCPEDSRLNKSIEYLEDEFEKTTDSYTLALMANAFANTNNTSLANNVIDILKKNIKTTENGSYVTSTIRDYYGSREQYQNIQATALTSIALTKLNSNSKTNFEFIKYIQSYIDYRGSWGTTQSTVLSLKAITDYTSNSELDNQTIVVSLNGEDKKVDIDENALSVYEFNFDNVEKENKLAIEMKKGKITYEIIEHYYEAYDKLAKTEDIVITQKTDTSTSVNGIITQRISVKNNWDYIENGLVEINIPQGTTVIEDSLLNLKYAGTIEKYEYNYGKINIYLRTLKKDEQVDLNIQYRALYPENITGGAIRVFDYYNPNVEGICKPINIEVIR